MTRLLWALGGVDPVVVGAVPRREWRELLVAAVTAVAAVAVAAAAGVLLGADLGGAGLAVVAAGGLGVLVWSLYGLNFAGRETPLGAEAILTPSDAQPQGDRLLWVRGAPFALLGLLLALPVTATVFDGPLSRREGDHLARARQEVIDVGLARLSAQRDAIEHGFEQYEASLAALVRARAELLRAPEVAGLGVQQRARIEAVVDSIRRNEFSSLQARESEIRAALVALGRSRDSLRIVVARNVAVMEAAGVFRPSLIRRIGLLWSSPRSYPVIALLTGLFVCPVWVRNRHPFRHDEIANLIARFVVLQNHSRFLDQYYRALQRYDATLTHPSDRFRDPPFNRDPLVPEWVGLEQLLADQGRR